MRRHWSGCYEEDFAVDKKGEGWYLSAESLLLIMRPKAEDMNGFGSFVNGIYKTVLMI